MANEGHLKSRQFDREGAAVLQGALRVDGPLVVSYDFVGHRQAQSDSQQLSCH
jgi:hypothetical protein